jgi:hypothetical protein
MKKGIDWKSTLITLALVAVGLLGYIFRIEILTSLKTFFEFKELTIYSGGLATIFTISHKLKTRKIKFSPNMSFNEFRIPFEDILSFVSNPITIVCSISLAKGLFLQSTDGDKYFPLFGSMELSFVGLVTAYLLFISMMELVKNMKETFLMASVPEKSPKAIPENEVKDVVPNPK